MPLPAGTRYRYKKGTDIRLAFAPSSNTVVEAKNMKTGATHTPAEFARDRSGKTKKTRKYVGGADALLD